MLQTTSMRFPFDTARAARFVFVEEVFHKKSWEGMLTAWRSSDGVGTLSAFVILVDRQ